MDHFLQTKAWQTFQESLGRKSISDKGKGWSYRAYLESGSGNTRLYAPYGPTTSSPEGFHRAIESLKQAAVKQSATFLRIEPIAGTDSTALRKLGFKPVTYQKLNPTRTQIIDLSPSSEDILKQMSQNSRNLTRNYSKKGIEIRSSTDPTDIEILIELLAKVARRNHITVHSDDYFRKQASTLLPIGAARLYTASLDDTVIAAALVYDSSDTRYYAHAAADDDYRKLSAGTALVGQMILDAKAAGLKYFDLYGIAPDNQPNHPWAGFTKFKQSFGGYPVDYLGAWDLPLKPLPYYIYRYYQSIRKRLP